MTYRIVVTTRVHPKKLTKELSQLANILEGSNPKYSHIRRTFWAIVLQEFFRRVRRSYIAKSWGKEDDLGHRWNVLTKPWIKRKARPHKRHGVMLPAAKHPQARNRDTDDLLDSLSPGGLVGDAYNPPQGQLVRRSQGRITVGSLVDYAAKAFKNRDVFPPGVNRWVRESITIAIRKITPLIAQMGS